MTSDKKEEGTYGKILIPAASGIVSAIVMALIIWAFGFAANSGRESLKIEKMAKKVDELSNLPRDMDILKSKLAKFEKSLAHVNERSRKLLIEAIDNNPKSARELLSAINPSDEIINGAELFREKEFAQAISIFSHAAEQNKPFAAEAHNVSIELLNNKIQEGEIPIEYISNELKNVGTLHIINGAIISNFDLY